MALSVADSSTAFYRVAIVEQKEEVNRIRLDTRDILAML